MNVRVMLIEPSTNPKAFNVVVLIGKSDYTFTITVETDKIAEQEIQITNGDDFFCQTFQFNQIVGVEICKLVSKIYNHQVVKLPVDVGEFYSEELESASLEKVS
ncbi:hypothetical protein [Aerosakkonema funiforme]|uniref:hypothetical protein n=1 Tax=Aerosakkonema funiforme TaxID=1246630 RepID=UPI0035B93B63